MLSIENMKRLSRYSRKTAFGNTTLVASLEEKSTCVKKKKIRQLRGMIEN